MSVLAGAWAFGSLATRPASSPAPLVSAPVVNLPLRAADGVAIDATYWPGRHGASPGILLLHGFGASRASVVDRARWLSGLGFAVLAIDFRGHGTSQQVPRSMGYLEAQDARAGFDWLKARQHGARIGVIGISQGGAAALIGPNGPLPADAMVLQAVYPDVRRAIRNRIAWVANWPIAWLGEPLLSLQSRVRFGIWPSAIAPVEAIRGYRGVTLVLGGGADPWTPAPETRELCDAASHCAELWIVPSKDHLQMASLDDEDYRARIGAFLSRVLEGGSVEPSDERR